MDEAGVKLTPSFMHSYMDGSIAARRIVEEGKIGEIATSACATPPKIRSIPRPATAAV
ncbi:MAG: hypothetical protein ACLRZH_14220 [Ruthenibacterium lactatiformans]